MYNLEAKSFKNATDSPEKDIRAQLFKWTAEQRNKETAEMVALTLRFFDIMIHAYPQYGVFYVTQHGKVVYSDININELYEQWLNQ